jgi:hypothetical protein
MHPRMEPDEITLFESLLRSSQFYLEFGSGGSTVLASQLVNEAVVSVDSSQAWLDKVKSECEKAGSRIRPTLVLADIGPVGEWGYPADQSWRSAWPEYYSAIWTVPKTEATDLCLVDGRFRVACFMTALMRCSDRALVAVHDFGERSSYAVIKEFADEIARTGSLSVFRRKASFDAYKALTVLDAVRFAAE